MKFCSPLACDAMLSFWTETRTELSLLELMRLVESCGKLQNTHSQESIKVTKIGSAARCCAFPLYRGSFNPAS
eukprot:scaffold788_cov56-Attheya_sp.AAC.11